MLRPHGRVSLMLLLLCPGLSWPGAAAGVREAAVSVSLPACDREMERLAERVGPAVVRVEAAGGECVWFDLQSTGVVGADANPRSSRRGDRLGLQCGSGVLIDPAGLALDMPAAKPPGRDATEPPATVGRPACQGLVLTCEHVVRGAETVSVVLSDGRRVRATVTGVDPRSDLAVLSVAAAVLPAVPLADAADLRCGQSIAAFGYPRGSRSTRAASRSAGVVAASGCRLRVPGGQAVDRYDGDLVRTTAVVEPGFSGGPLVDRSGAVVGVLTAVDSDDAGASYAIPVNARTLAVIDRLRRGESVEYGNLGVEVRPEGGAAGARIVAVAPGAPGDRAGLRPGDVVVRFGAATVASDDQFIRRVGAALPGTRVELEYVRAGRRMQTVVVVGRRAAPVRALRVRFDLAVAWRGALFGPVPTATQSDRGLPRGALLVLRVEADSPAVRAGLEPGQVVVRIGGQRLEEARTAAERLTGVRGDTVLGMANGAVRLVCE